MFAMAWSMPVNEMLTEEISKLDYTLIPSGYRGDAMTTRLMQESLTKAIDQLGEESCKEQGLTKIITTAEKLRQEPNHTLYLLKDPQGNGGQGEIIGFLKVGQKKLYMYDSHDEIYESEPLCLLDFYVLKDRQRNGVGRKLFDYMLRDMEVTPKQLAVDGPSEKLLTFLRKHYGMDDLMRQSNNFAVTSTFFTKELKELNQIRASSGRSTPLVSLVPPSIGRYSATKPPSSIATVIHGGNDFKKDIINGNTPSSSRAATPRSTTPVEEAVPPAPERPSSLHIETDTAPARADTSPAAGCSVSRRSSQVNEQGFFDLKFHHNKLWASSGRSTPLVSLVPPSIGRYSATKPPSSIATVIHGGNDLKKDIINGNTPSSSRAATPRSTTPVEEAVPPAPERPSSLHIETDTAPARADTSPAAGSSVSRRSSQVNEQGFFDLKFHHNKLW